MSTATLARTHEPERVIAARHALEASSRRVADATAEFDTALDAGCPMMVLVKLDREVADATRDHRAALAEARRTA